MVIAGDSQSELTKLMLKNQTLQMLLKEHLKKNSLHNDEDDTEASSRRQVIPPENNNNTTPPAPIIPPPAPTHTEGRKTEKAKAVQISTLEVPVVIQRKCVFIGSRKKMFAPRLGQSMT